MPKRYNAVQQVYLMMIDLLLSNAERYLFSLRLKWNDSMSAALSACLHDMYFNYYYYFFFSIHFNYLDSKSLHGVVLATDDVKYRALVQCYDTELGVREYRWYNRHELVTTF